MSFCARSYTGGRYHGGLVWSGTMVALRDTRSATEAEVVPPSCTVLVAGREAMSLATCTRPRMRTHRRTMR